jgi:hypothetical protein
MSELTYAQLRAEEIEQKLKEFYPAIPSYSNQWMLQLIESLLQQHPQLKSQNFHLLTIKDLLHLINTYVEDVTPYYDVDNSVLVIEAKPTKPFISIKEFIVLFIISALKQISLLHFIFGIKRMQSVKCIEVESFPYIYQSSVVLINEDKQQYHFINSINLLVQEVSLQPDEFVNKISSRPTNSNKHGDSTIQYYIENNEFRKDIEDTTLIAYLKMNPENIDIKVLSKNINQKFKGNKL